MNKKITSSVALFIIFLTAVVAGCFLWMRTGIFLTEKNDISVQNVKKLRYKMEEVSYKNKSNLPYVKYSYPIITGGIDIIPRQKINQSIKELVTLDAKNHKKDFDDNALDYGSDEKWVVDGNGELISSLEKFPVVNIVFSSLVYTGGAHGSHDIQVLIFNTDTGEKLSSGSLFKEGYLQKLSSLSFEVLKKNNTQNPGIIYSDEIMVKDGLKPKVDNFSNFILEKDGLHIIFDEYQVGPYVSGNQEVVIPYEDIQSVMTDSFKKLVGIKDALSINNTKKWQTYTNSENKFSVDYPSNWKTGQIDNVIGFMPSTKSMDESYIGEWQIIINTKTDSTLEVLLDEFGFNANPKSKKTESVTINGKRALFLSSTLEDGSLLEAVSFENGDSRIVLVGTDQERNLFQRFYYSFKFY